MENVLRLPSLRKVSFLAVNFPWATLFQSKKSLDDLTALYVGYIDEEGVYQAGDGQIDVPMPPATTIRHLHTCPSSAMVLANAPIPPINTVQPAETQAFVFDFTSLHTLVLLFRRTSTGIDATWKFQVQALLRRAPTLRKLVFQEIKCSFVHFPPPSLPYLRVQSCF